MICEFCNKEHNVFYGSNRFCSSKCAKAFATKNDNKYTKSATCKLCGKHITVNKRANINNTYCEDCKKLKPTRKCAVCGRPLHICKSSSTRYICLKYQIFPSLIKYFGFDESKLNSTDIFEEYHKIRQIIIEEYWENENTLNDLMKLFHYNSENARNFSKILRTLDIDIRTRSESRSLSLLLNKSSMPQMGKNYPYKHGWHTTWENKKIYFRSSYELDYALKLDNKKISYEVEYLRLQYWDTQKYKYRIAIPDFYLPKYNLLVEIKSIYTLDKQNMKDKFKVYEKYGYKTKLYVDHKELKL